MGELTTEVVKDAACYPHEVKLGEPRKLDRADFDQWLAGIKAEALRSAAEVVDTYPSTDQASTGIRALADLIEEAK